MFDCLREFLALLSNEPSSNNKSLNPAETMILDFYINESFS